MEHEPHQAGDRVWFTPLFQSELVCWDSEKEDRRAESEEPARGLFTHRLDDLDVAELKRPKAISVRVGNEVRTVQTEVPVEQVLFDVGDVDVAS